MAHSATPIDYRIDPLAPDDEAGLAQARSLLVEAFADEARYGEARITAELSIEPPPYYRGFVVAREGDRVIGVGGMKAADWASNTHLLYLSAVAPEARGRGIGTTLVTARIEAIRRHHEAGRILVSTAKVRRFRALGFRTVQTDKRAGRQLMMLTF